MKNTQNVEVTLVKEAKSNVIFTLQSLVIKKCPALGITSAMKLTRKKTQKKYIRLSISFKNTSKILNHSNHRKGLYLPNLYRIQVYTDADAEGNFRT